MKPEQRLIAALLRLRDASDKFFDVSHQDYKSMSTSQTLHLLRMELDESTLQAGVKAALGSAMAKLQQGSRLSMDEAYIVDSCLRLASVDDGVLIDKKLAQQCVSFLEAGYWFIPVSEIIKRYLSETDVLEAIDYALQPERNEGTTFSALEAIRLYQGVAQRASEPEDFGALARRVEDRVHELAIDLDSGFSEEAKRAIEFLHV